MQKSLGLRGTLNEILLSSTDADRADAANSALKYRAYTAHYYRKETNMANYLVSLYRVEGDPVCLWDKQYDMLPSDSELRQCLKDVAKNHPGTKLRGEVYEYRSDSVIHRFGDNN